MVVHALERKGLWGEKGNSHIFTGTGWEREVRGLLSQRHHSAREAAAHKPRRGGLSAEPVSEFLTL